MPKVSLDFTRMKRDWQGQQEARTWVVGSKVNWTAVAKNYSVHQPVDQMQLAHNGGQIVQALVEHTSISPKHFTTAYVQQTGKPCARRANQRSQAGTTVACHTSLSGPERQKEKLYEEGRICKPIAIVPRQYELIKFTFGTADVQVRQKNKRKGW